MVGLNKKTVRDINLSGRRVLLRADYNVPILQAQGKPVKDSRVVDDYRIRRSLPTISYILDQKPAALVIISHLGRPEGKPNPDLSLLPVVKRLSQLLGHPVGFAMDCVGPQAKAAGKITLFENLRFHEEEENNDPAFAKAIVEAAGANIFVQDGFGVVHRKHASTDAITRLLPSVGGLLLEKEIEVLIGAIQRPQHPFVAVVGGAKISDKIEVLHKFIDIADGVAVVGALANNFLKADGIKIGKSVYEPEAMEAAREILHRAKLEEKRRDFNFFIPVDAVVSRSIDGRLPTRLVDLSSHTFADIGSYPKGPPPTAYTVAGDELILDIGPISAREIAGAIKMSKMVIWGGTAGVTETKGLAGADAPFSHGTRILAEAMIGASNNHKNKPFSIVGGGDTVAYVEAEGLLEDFNHVSTGGSASLELMAGKKLPGIEALADRD